MSKILRQRRIRLRRRNWILVVGLLVIAAAGGLGCAKTVTQIFTYGEQMTVTVTLRGNVDLNANRYFLVLSNNANYKVPLPLPDIIDAAPEMIEPGTSPKIGTAEAYYSNFFSTWSSYIILDSLGCSLVKGPFALNQATTREVIDSLDQVSQTISFSGRLGQIFTTVPALIYFDFVAVPWVDGAEKLPADHLATTNNYLSRAAGSILTVPDTENTSLNASVDILDCKVEIQ